MLGLIEPVNTHMYITRAAGSSAIVNAFEAGTLHVHPVQPDKHSKKNQAISKYARGDRYSSGNR